MKDSTAVSAETGAELPSSKLFRNIKGIIFDFDGTLFDNIRLPFYLIAANPLDILRLWRERLVRKSFAGSDYSSAEKYYRAFFTSMGKSGLSSPERLHSWYFNRYMPRMTRVLKKHYRLRPGVIELYNRLDPPPGISNPQAKPALPAQPLLPRDFPKLAVYSDYPFLKERLEALGLDCSSKVLLYGPESFGAQKPAVRPFLKIADDFGIAPEEVLVIGDREETDGMGAFRAGMRFFCLETGRKRYFRLDPNRRPPDKEKPHGPSLLMHAGTWDELIKLFREKYRFSSDWQN